MIDVIKSIIDMIVQFLNGIFNYQIEFADNVSVSVGIIVCAFVLFVVSIYIILKTMKVIGDDK